MATVLLLASRQPDHLITWIGALTAALAISGVVLLAANHIRRALGDQMVAAIEKLMGLVLTAVAVEDDPRRPQAVFHRRPLKYRPQRLEAVPAYSAGAVFRRE